MATATADLFDGEADEEKTKQVIRSLAGLATNLIGFLGSVTQAIPPEVLAALGDSIMAFDALSVVMG